MFREANKNIILFFLIGIAIIAKSQTNKLIFDEKIDLIKLFPNKEILKNKIFLLGEYHYQTYNKQIQYSYLNALNEIGIYPKYIILEKGYAYSYILNKYLLTGSEEDLYSCTATKKDRAFLKQVYEYRQTLSEEHKFIFKGIDAGNEITSIYLAIYCVLNKVSGLKEFNDSTVYNYAGSVVKDFCSTYTHNPGNNEMKRIVKTFNLEYNLDSTAFKPYLKEDYKNLQKILEEYRKYLKFRKINYERAGTEKLEEREQFMAENLYNLYMQDTTAILFGQFGSSHIPLSFQKKWTHDNFNSLASRLNTGTIFKQANHKVYSSLIIYDYLPYSWYKFLGTTKAHFKESKMKFSSSIMHLSDYENKNTLNSLIFFNSKKVK